MSNDTVTMMVRQRMLEVEMASEAAAEHRARARKLVASWLRAGLGLRSDVIEHLGIKISEEDNGLNFTFTNADIQPVWVWQGDAEWPADDDLSSKASEFKPYKNGGTFSPLLAAAHSVASKVMWHVAEQAACKPVLEARGREEKAQSCPCCTRPDGRVFAHGTEIEFDPKEYPMANAVQCEWTNPSVFDMAGASSASWVELLQFAHDGRIVAHGADGRQEQVGTHDFNKGFADAEIPAHVLADRTWPACIRITDTWPARKVGEVAA